MPSRLRRRRPADGPGRSHSPGRLRRALRWAGAHVGPRTARGWDALLGFAAAVLFVVTWATVVLTHQVGPGVAPGIAVVTALPLVLARARPLVGWGATMLLGLAMWAFVDPRASFDLPWTVPQVIVLYVLAVGVALRERLHVVVGVWAAGLALLVLCMPVGVREGLGLGLTALTVLALLVRWLILSRRQLARQEEVSELERARRAVLEERSRIARDLHDVVAHRMSLVVVQAQSAPARLGSLEPDVVDEFRSISEQARAALNEVRAMLGVLRSEDRDPTGTPQHGTADVVPLLRQTRNAGVDLAWELTGDPARVGAGVGIVVYRILQEALANATRHAAGGRVRVAVGYTDPLRIVVRSGPSTDPPLSGSDRDDGGTHSGIGLIAMADRARSVGGTLEAGPAPDGGFVVTAVLPPSVQDTGVPTRVR